MSVLRPRGLLVPSASSPLSQGGGGIVPGGTTQWLFHFDNAYTNSGNWPVSLYASSGVNFTAASKFGTHSARFPAAGSYIYYQMTALTIPKNGPWCIEGWFYAYAASRMYLFDHAQQNKHPWIVTFGGTTGWVEFYNPTDGHLVNHAVPVISVGVWHHLALSFTGTTWSFFIDGIQAIADVGFAPSIDLNFDNVLIGTQYGIGYHGLIDELRLTVGSPVYTGSFTPPTAPYTV